jgi:hypothetical protein
MTDSKESATTIVIRRPTKVKTDKRGRAVWTGAIEETEFDLMSSQDLKLALQAADGADRESIRAIAESGKNGVVARERGTGLYHVIPEDELQELMDNDAALSASIRGQEMAPESADGDSEEELALVSTQALRRMLDPIDVEDALDVSDDNPGFDPYDKG